MNGKADTGQVNSSCASGPMPKVSGPKQDTGQLPTRPTGGSIPGVSGDSSGNSPKAYSGVPPVAECKEGSPNNGANPTCSVSGPERMPITGYGN